MASPRRTLLVGASLLTVLVGCTGDERDGSAPTTSVVATTTTIAERADDGRLLIGLYLPQTGPGASLGEPMIAAAQAAIAHINEVGGVLGRGVDSLVLDEGSATGPASLVADGVDAIIGPASSRNAVAQLSTVVRSDTGVVTCSPTATAASLNDYPDNGYFFRTAPSDSLQMVAIARRAERTGVPTVAVGYLDDPYGRALSAALVGEITARPRQDVVAEVGFGADQEDLRSVVAELLADGPGLVVVLGDPDDGGRLLTALDEATNGRPPQVIVNDAIRNSAAIPQLSPEFRSALTGVAPRSVSDDELAQGFFTAHAIDCVNLIALAAIEAGTDAPSDIRLWMAPVSGGGRQCTSFEGCVALQEQGLQIDYNGLSGPIELSSTTGDPAKAVFDQFGFDVDGNEIDTRTFEVP